MGRDEDARLSRGGKTSSYQADKWSPARCDPEDDPGSSGERSDTDEFVYVRECFDELYFRLGQLQDAIDNDLVELKHVSCPVDYYVGLLAEDVKMHYDYMREYKYQRALKFLENFVDWENAREAAKLPRTSCDTNCCRA